MNYDVLERLLIETEYCQEETQFLVNGFKNGFDLQYQGPKKRKDYSNNIPLTTGSKEELWNKIMKEIKEKRVASPFSKVPYKYFVQSPIGLVPKDDGKQTRLIFHLSFDFKQSGNKSINF